MIRTTAMILAASALLAAAPPAFAESGAEMLEACGDLAKPARGDTVRGPAGSVVRIADGVTTRGGDAFRQGLCSGIVSTAIYHGRDIDPHTRFCVPEAVTVGEAASEVVRYMMDFPQILHTDIRSIADAALKRAYPCG